MQTLSKALCKGILVSLLLALMSQRAAEAQQQSLSIDDLKQQIARLEEIAGNPTTPDEVRTVNQTFITSRRAELRRLLVRRRDALREYLKASVGVLRPEETEKVEAAIRQLESELSGARGESSPAPARVVNANFEPATATPPQ